MVFIKDFIESCRHSLFDLDQLKVYILTCRLCPQVKMLFMSRFTSQLIEPPSPQVYYSAALWLQFHPSPSIRQWRGRDSKERKEGWGLGSAHPCWVEKGPNISRHASRDPAGPVWLRHEWDEGVESCSQSLTGSLGPSLLIDWSPGAAAPFCKVHYIITLQKNNTFDKHKITRILIQPQATNGLWRERREEKKHSKMFE